jgi:hypothetical protein
MRDAGIAVLTIAGREGCAVAATQAPDQSDREPGAPSSAMGAEQPANIRAPSVRHGINHYRLRRQNVTSSVSPADPRNCSAARSPDRDRDATGALSTRSIA